MKLYSFQLVLFTVLAGTVLAAPTLESQFNATDALRYRKLDTRSTLYKRVKAFQPPGKAGCFPDNVSGCQTYLDDILQSLRWDLQSLRVIRVQLRLLDWELKDSGEVSAVAIHKGIAIFKKNLKLILTEDLKGIPETFDKANSDRGKLYQTIKANNLDHGSPIFNRLGSMMIVSGLIVRSLPELQSSSNVAKTALMKLNAFNGDKVTSQLDSIDRFRGWQSLELKLMYMIEVFGYIVENIGGN